MHYWHVRVDTISLVAVNLYIVFLYVRDEVILDMSHAGYSC